MDENSNDLPHNKIIIDYPYPRQIIENIRKGKPADFQELIKTGMVISYIFFNEEDLQNQINTLKIWGINQDTVIGVDFDDQQKELDRLVEIHRNGGVTDHDSLVKLFEKICIYSSNLSEHIEDSTLLTSNTIEVTFGDGQKAWYFAMASHPDLIEGKRLDQYCNNSLSRLHQNLRKVVKQIKKMPKRKNFTEQQKSDCRKKQDGKCNKCQKHPPRWEYNHKDGDRTNNVDSNIEGFCPSCHSVVTYDE